MAYGGAIAALFNPFVGLLIYISFAILRPEFLWYWSVPQGQYSRVVALGLLAGWVVHGMGRWQFDRAGGVVAALIGYWLWSVISAFAAPDQIAAWTFVESLSKIALPFIVGITVVNSVPQLKQLAWVIAGSHAFLAYEFNLSYWGGWNRVMAVGHGGADENVLSIGMVAAAGFTFFLAMSVRRWWLKLLAFVSVLLMAHVILFAFSRGGMLGLIVVGFAGFCLIPRKPAHYLILAVVLALGLRLAGTEVRQEFMTVFAESEERDESAQSRLDLWSDAWDAMLRNPVLGLGPDHWPLVAAAYGWPEGKEVHSLWLQLGAELGFPGLLLLLAFYGLCIVRLWPIMRGRQAVFDPWLRPAALMVIVSLIGFGAAAQFVTVEALEVPYYIALVGAGVLKVASQAEGPLA